MHHMKKTIGVARDVSMEMARHCSAAGFKIRESL